MAKIEQLKRRTNRSTTAIVKEALAQYLESQAASPSSAKQIFHASGFIGCADGPEDLSTSYKEALVESLTAKVE